MERDYQDVNETLVRPSPEPQQASRGTPVRRNNSSGGNAQRFGGMHQRRDKRFPFAHKYESEVALAPAAPPAELPLAADPLTAWKEAVMLWLSWNSTQEKLTAKMCKPGCDQQKIEALLDEADALRKRAIGLSETLIQQA